MSDKALSIASSMQATVGDNVVARSQELKYIETAFSHTDRTTA
jgi:hypothetical protein